MFTTIFAAGALVGPPISGAIYVATGGFEAVGYYAGMMTRCSSDIFDAGADGIIHSLFTGSMVLLAVALLCVVRQLVLGRLWGKI